MTMYRTAIKRMFLVILAVILMMPAVFAGSAKADKSGKDKSGWSLVTVEVDLRRNVLMAQYGVTIMLDGYPVRHMAHGSLATLDLLIPHGDHRLEFVSDDYWSDSAVWELSFLRDEYVLECNLQTHLDYVGMNDHRVTADSRPLTQQMKQKIIDWTVNVSDTIPFVDISGQISGSF